MDNRTSFFQWDLNQRLVLSDVEVGTELHFCNPMSKETECLTVFAYEDDGVVYADVPNVILQIPGSFKVYVWPFYTSKYRQYTVISRPKPADYIYEEVEIYTIEQVVKSSIEKELENQVGKRTENDGLIFGDFQNNIADGEFAEAHGKNTKAKAPFATTFGQDTSVYSARGFAGGFNVQLEGEAENTFAWGTGLRSNTRDQILFGRYNVKDPEAVLIIGDGSNDKNRSNAVVIKKDGRIVHKVTETKLLGKKISFTGDSICAGLIDPSIGEKYNYAMLLQEKYGMNVLANIAQGGGTICKTTRYGGSVENFCIAESVNLLPEDSDYVILSGGVNDAAHMVDYEITLGSVQTSYTYPPTISVGKNFAKAFEKMLYDASVRFAGKKIGFISTHQMTNRYSVVRPEEDNFYLIAKKSCGKWGIPFLDLTTSVPPYALIYPRLVGNENDLEKVKKFFVDEGWHPSKLGYETLYLPKLVSWLESL